jgi:predicted amidohydrolase YtcJ
VTSSPKAASPSSALRNHLRPRHLREAHAHLASYGHSLALPSLADCRGVTACLDAVRRESSVQTRASARPFIRFTSARPEGWSGPEGARWPTRRELDAAAGDLPVVLMSFDHHAAVANSAALMAAGLRAGVPVPPSGVVCADDRGEPTGLLLEHAAYAAWSAAPEPTPQERREHVRAAAAALAAMGYTEVHDLLSAPDLGPILKSLERAGDLPVRVRLYALADSLEQVAAGRVTWETASVRLAGGKLFADGTLNSRTALMLGDYRDPIPGHPRGRAMLSADQVSAAAESALRLGLGLAVHAIGDGAVRMVLDAYERIPSHSRGPGGGDLRIEHCELIDEADVPRFARLGVVCSVQPCHLLSDIEALVRYLPHRLSRVLPLRELIDSGCRPGASGEWGGQGGLWFGSDVPIVRADPEDSVVAATQRRRPGMPDADAIAPEQRITEGEAWAAFAATKAGGDS